MTNSVWTPYAAATLDGVPLTGTIRKARVTSTFSDPVSKAYVEVYPAQTWNEGASLSVALGGGVHNLTRFNGTVYESDNLNSGPTCELVARGPLYKAQKFRNNNPNGLTLQDLTGGPATDQAITQAVLTVAGVTFTSGNIGGTSIVRGTLAPAPYTWRFGETALAYLARLSQASLGYRMIESIGGEVFRVQVYGRPQGTSSFTLTEGVDIFEGAHAQLETFSKYTAITVTGFDFGTGSGALTFSNPDPTPAGVEPFPFASDMIERALEADPGLGVSAEAVGAIVLAEVNRRFIHVSGLTTPRDELFGPGQTHTVNAASLNLTNESLWLFGVTCEVSSDWFTQSMDYAGGGSSTGGYTGP